ncbi:uncharacterized protein LOC129808848 [Phlebotomus papatasi]|uniref:uncharacterized protein LOC129808848 n=1 Tax=Phlebotomus papatasi TaxID=29031 RepID=UPI002484685E|nr:uncharacterized protein LOC129808848 [Phlebotomus papatasi]
MVNAKCLMQNLWQLKCDWDEEVPESVLSEWISFLKSLRFIPNIKIPRCISEFTQISKREVHLFTDASKKAYGAAIYIVTENSSGFRSTRLLTAKCRVAPVKVATIPKLELCAAALGSRILKAVCDSLNCHNHYCWTDAMIVLCQIRSPVKREAFVKKRLEDILNNTRAERWHHVPTTHNPADLISRGVTAEQLDESSLWWKGPDWLSKSIEYWPTEPEGHQEGCLLATTAQWPDIRKGTQQSGPLLPEEIQRAEIVLVRLEQQELLVDDIKTLSGPKKTPVSKQLRHLQVFLDDDKVMRVKGRLENANVDENTKQPMILPSGPLAKMILHHEHYRLLHAGPTLIMTEIRRKFWPIFGRRLPRDVYWRCITCNKAKPRPCKQLMGQLPTPRVTLTRPFASTGVDFAGPVLVKASKLRKAPVQKTYLAVFICMAVKAVHIEVVGDLTTEAFLASLRRFSARRGTPNHVYSDNGTNFVGAAHSLGKFLANPANQNALIDATSGNSITWHFIPPRSPHWGGLWEAAVKTLKYHLNRIMGTTVLTYEELTTVTTQIEGVMNSRPLTALPETEADPDALTPAHLLMTKPITNLPDWDLEKVFRLDRWQLTQKLYQDISKRWKREYLVSLQRRSKWDKEYSNLHPGDVVLVLDNASSGASWPIARVVDIHPGRDGRVRLVTIRMKNGTYKRPIHVLAKLPTESEHPETSELAKGDFSLGNVLAPTQS